MLTGQQIPISSTPFATDAEALAFLKPIRVLDSFAVDRTVGPIWSKYDFRVTEGHTGYVFEAIDETT